LLLFHSVTLLDIYLFHMKLVGQSNLEKLVLNFILL
jgi:hypothetical protein